MSRMLLACGVAIVFSSVASAALVDVTGPGDTIYAIHGTGASTFVISPELGTPPGEAGYPAENAPQFAIDNDLATKYLNIGAPEFNTGLIITPAVGPTIIKALRIATASDVPENDPMGFLLEGTNVADPTASGVTWTGIAWGATGLGVDDPGRGAWSTPNGPNTFDEHANSYTSYRLVFVNLRDGASATAMHIAEIELLANIPEPASLALLGVAGPFVVRRR